MSYTLTVPRVLGGTIFITFTLGSYTPPLVLSVSFATPKAHINPAYAATKAHINPAFAAPKEHINSIFSEVAMTTPFTTIDVSATVTDQNGSLVTSLSTYTLTVTFQDGTTTSPTVSNAGSGKYTASYNTKGVGTLTELWNFVDGSGAIAEDQVTRNIAF